ncbi:seryl-tRNA synthetase [Perkinsela sp. CCAP 1560/4]|nr:seryl-tRNA synthetase [Perkinsela sp. CCAP 1560/4]|eukprot:KNH03771.1 seryl-tRNA synthetase [Perkinsela sp. CCAP 1560/4]
MFASQLLRFRPQVLQGKPTRGSQTSTGIKPRFSRYFVKRRWCYHPAGKFVRNTPPLGLQCKVHCVDNSNCRQFYLLRQWHEAYANSQTIPCAVKRVSVLQFKSGEEVHNYQKLEPGDVRHAVILTRRSMSLRYSGIVTQFDKNTGILLDDKGAPLGTRIMYVAGRHINHRFSLKTAVMANFIV